MTPRRHIEPAGFTLLEVLIALGILLVGIIAVMQLFPLSLSAARQASEDTITSQAAHSILGQVRATSAEAVFNDQLPDDLLKLQRANGLYGFTTTVQRLAGAHEIYLQRVTFTVTFANDRQETFTTYITRR